MRTYCEIRSARTKPQIKLVRTGKTCQSSYGVGKKATGKRGKLTIAGKTFHTIERADGFVSLPPGVYNCKTGRRGSNGKPCIQITHSVTNNRGKRAGIVIHAANKPHHLAGCIAPGRTLSSTGVLESGLALRDIFEALGASDTKFSGHKETKKVDCKLVVSGK